MQEFFFKKKLHIAWIRKRIMILKSFCPKK